MASEEVEHYILCEESTDLAGQLDYWKRRYEMLLQRVVPPWVECQEAIANIKRLEEVLKIE